jgi:hypothetical protein
LASIWCSGVEGAGALLMTADIREISETGFPPSRE